MNTDRTLGFWFQSDERIARHVLEWLTNIDVNGGFDRSTKYTSIKTFAFKRTYVTSLAPNWQLSILGVFMNGDGVVTSQIEIFPGDIRTRDGGYLILVLHRTARDIFPREVMEDGLGYEYLDNGIGCGYGLSRETIERINSIEDNQLRLATVLFEVVRLAVTVQSILEDLGYKAVDV